MTDIQTREDIKTLVDRFYEQATIDEVIGMFFSEVAQLDFAKHMPIMYDFWESTLFQVAKYKGNPMLVHLQLNDKKSMKEEHFDRWLQLWENTIRSNFEGENAERAIKKANQIAGLMKYKIEQKAMLNRGKS